MKDTDDNKNKKSKCKKCPLKNKCPKEKGEKCINKKK